MNSFKYILGGIFCLLFLQTNAQDLVADNMLMLQRKSGGWSKHYHGKSFRYDMHITDSLRADIAVESARDDANIDNESTKTEIIYLIKAYKRFNYPQYLEAAENGIRFLLKAQYKNGGWPQYFPDNSGYRGRITYNDNVMINVMNLLQDVALRRNDMDVVDPALVAPSAEAVRKGIDCILKTQIKVNSKLTGWCQQYDEVTLKPAKARAYELPSVSSFATVELIRFLMKQQNSGIEIRNAINAAAQWLQDVKITGYRVSKVRVPDAKWGTDRLLVADTAAPAMLARYYEIGTNKPFFCDRDGLKKYSISEIGYERRNGYAWYGNWAAQLLENEYPVWVRNNQQMSCKK